MRRSRVSFLEMVKSEIIEKLLSTSKVFVDYFLRLKITKKDHI
jgi:hypothetical protein